MSTAIEALDDSKDRSMQTFTIGLGRLWWIRAFGRNPLLRRSDRIEAAVFMLAVLIVVITTPVAGAIGTSVHDAHARLYAEEAHHRHQVIATAIEEMTFVGRAGFGVIDHVGRAVCTENGKYVEGWGLFEHGALGRHDPSGFADWLTVAP